MFTVSSPPVTELVVNDLTQSLDPEVRPIVKTTGPSPRLSTKRLTVAVSQATVSSPTSRGSPIVDVIATSLTPLGIIVAPPSSTHAPEDALMFTAEESWYLTHPDEAGPTVDPGIVTEIPPR